MLHRVPLSLRSLTANSPCTFSRSFASSSSSSFPTSSVRSTFVAQTPNTSSNFQQLQPISRKRSFSTSFAAQASEAPQSPFGENHEDTLFNRLQHHPEIIQAIERLALMAKEKTGVDLQAGQKPSMKMMMGLASDPELQQAAASLMHSLRDAGINIDPRAAFQALKTMGGQDFDKLNLEDMEAMKKSGWGGDGEGEGEGQK